MGQFSVTIYGHTGSVLSDNQQAVYSSYRDVSGILTPGAAWLILLAAPISGIFAAAGVASLLAWGIAGRLHPRLGENRMKPVKPLQIEQRILFHET